MSRCERARKPYLTLTPHAAHQVGLRRWRRFIRYAMIFSDFTYPSDVIRREHSPPMPLR